MGNHRSRFRAPLLLSLIGASQVPRCSAHPFIVRDSPENTDTISEAQQFTPTVTAPCSTSKATNVVQQIDDGQVQVQVSSNDANENARPSNVVYQIPDGQVQWQVPIASTTLSSVSTSSLSSTSLISARDLTTETSGTAPYGLPSAPWMLAEQTESYTATISDSSLTSLTTSEVQTATESAPTSTSGSVVSTLESSGNQNSLPFPTTIPDASTSLSLVDTATVSNAEPTATAYPSAISANNIFQQIARDAPPSQVVQRDDHPQPTTGIQPQSHRLQTNKFYAGFYLASQNTSSFLFPYSVVWPRGNGDLNSWGLAVSHTERDDIAYGPFKTEIGTPEQPGTGYRLDAGEWAYYANPLGVYSIVLSASELAETDDAYPGLTTEKLEWGSVTVNLFPINWLTPVIQFPLVQGASFITAQYSWGTPLIQSGIGFQNVTYAGAVANNNTFKYRALLQNGYTWLIYVTPDRSPDKSPDYPCDRFDLNGSATNLQGHSGFNGIIQVAKVPGNATNGYSGATPESLYDSAAGAWASDVSISGTVDGTTGSYTLSWTKNTTKGNENQSLMMFALPHQLASIDSSTSAGLTNLKLMTTVKGQATAIRGKSWTLVEEDLPIEMSFGPWKPGQGSLDGIDILSGDDKAFISNVGNQELSVNITNQTMDMDSFYYTGKQFAKFATILWTQYQLVGNQSLELTSLPDLEQALGYWINGNNKFPLVYDNVWGGAASRAAYDDPSNLNADFGNTLYNDHHFHFGYFVYAAAVIGYLDPAWLTESNKAWVNMLVRDYANSIVDDKYYPFSRSFDWYHGHSWAAGLFPSADGKNQESSSEDTMASYAIKMWGFVVGDKNMMARGNLMLAVQKRALNLYYLYDNSTQQPQGLDLPVQPPEFAGNKAAGILFENKIDHTTYFGAKSEYIEGIHMIPTMPFSSYIRSADIIQSEWDTYFANYTSNSTTPSATPYIDSILGGWKGILVADYCIANPEYGYKFFRNETFDNQALDGGASRTWYLAWCAALKGQS